jgi:hypothetical protein
MTTFFHRTSFDFSQQAKDWILDRYASRFDRYFNHNLDSTQGTVQIQQEWHRSNAGQELIDFLAQYNCSTSYFGISAHISNQATSAMCNPHIDFITSKEGVRNNVLSRFNVLILGNPLDTMHWWPTMVSDHPALVDITRKNNQTGFEFKSKVVPGDTIPDRIQFLGTAPIIEANVASPSAFIKTDCVHSINLSAGPRLVVTVAFNKSLTDIIGP